MNFRIIRICIKATGALSILLLHQLAGQARAQSAYNPYEPFTNQYRDYSRPGGFNAFDTMSNNRSQNSTYQAEMDRLLGGRETATGKSRDSDRYYNAYRKYDEQLDRLYRPNQKVDELYNQRKNTRDSVYFKALRERDPKKRAEMLKSYSRGEDLSALRDDQKVSEKSAAEKRKSAATSPRGKSSATTKGRGGSSPSTTGRSGGGSRGGLLGPDPDDDDPLEKTDSLIDRSGRLSEEFRPTAPPRGYGSLRSREEQKRGSTGSRSAAPTSSNPGLPGLRP